MVTTKKPTIHRLSAVRRVSRKNGREGSKFMSPAEQTEAVERWAHPQGVELFWHDETDSVSAKTTDRTGLKAALDEAITGRTDGVVVAKVDRFARNVTEGLFAIRQLQAAGKAFVAIAEGINGDEQSSTPMGRLWLTILLALAAWQLETLTEGWDSAVARHIANGVAAHDVYGYRRDIAPPGTPKTDLHLYSRRYVIEPDEAKWVVFMFEQRAAGASWHAIADALTDHGVLTPSGGDRWSYTTVGKTVVNRTYLGELRSGEHVNPAAHEPIVTLDLWRRVERIKDTTPVKRGRASYPLSGLVRCAGCGVRMVGKTKKVPATSVKEAHEIRYYGCRRRHGGWGVCPDPAHVNAADLERHVEASFRADFFDILHNANARVTTGELDDALARLHDAEADADYWATSPAVSDQRRALGDDWFEKATMARTAAVLKARTDVTRLQAETMGVDLPDGLADAWDSPRMTDEQRRHYLSLAYSVIAVASSRDHRVPVEARCRLWLTDEPGAPDNLPSRGRAQAMRPIVFDAP